MIISRNVKHDGFREFVFFFGGLAPLGGIEAFAADLFEALERWPRTKALLAWTRDPKVFSQFNSSDATIYRSLVTRGCRAGVPDYFLVLQSWLVLRHAKIVVFGKLPQEGVFRLLTWVLSINNRRRARLVFITPYRPRDLWPARMPIVYTENLDHIIVQSQTFATDLRELGYAGEVTVLPYCPPRTIDKIDPCEDYSSVIRVGFLGRLEPQKNLPYLLQFSRLMRNEVRLEIFGDGTERPRLERLADDCPHLVQFHGAIDRKLIPSVIDSCDVFVVPSVSEGQCLAALEIIARGKPLIATPVGALPELMLSGRFGSLIPLNDEIGAAALLDKMVDELRLGLWPRQSIMDNYKAVFDRTAVELSYISLFERLID